MDRLILATVRKLHKATVAVTAKTIVTMVDPVLVLGFLKRIEVEYRFPLRGSGNVVIQRCASPDSSNMYIVLPEVVEVIANDAALRNAGVGCQNRKRLVVELLVEIVVTKLVEGFRVLIAYPIQGLLVLDFFQPQIRVVVGKCGAAGQGCDKRDTGNETNHQANPCGVGPT